jgi:hypothetical protein
MAVDIRRYLNRKTLILGDVNTGKSRLTLAVLDAFLDRYPPESITVIDLAPQLAGGVGGKLAVPSLPGLQYLTADIVPPRLTTSDEVQMIRLAEANAAAAEKIFDVYLARSRPVLIVNDATLYLQAGLLNRFTSLLEQSATAVINAYFGSYFPDSPLGRRERRLTEALTSICDVIEHLEIGS